jgi:hypothetical protein
MISQEPEQQVVTNKGFDALPRLILQDQESRPRVSQPRFAGQHQERIRSQTFSPHQHIEHVDPIGTSLNVLESVLAGVAGAGIAFATQGPIGAFMGGLNGVISGATQIYDWTSWTGWAAFVVDSSWGMIGTDLGIVLHAINLFYGSGNKYRHDLSFRQNRHVYDGGFGFSGFSMTQGNVTSNLAGGGGGTELLNHESLHILQSRLFGPIYQITYGAWLIVGGVIGGIVGIFASQPWTTSVQDVAYYDNLWETWAYKVEGPDSGSHHGGELSWS